MPNLIALFSVALITMSSSAFAATCDAQAAEKKLAGAAKNSFVQKCEKDAAAALAWLASTILTARRQLSWPVEAGNEFNALLA